MEHLQRRDLTGGRKWCPNEVKRFWGEEVRLCKSHPYLEKMGIGDPGVVGVIGDTLVIPMWTTRKRLANLQLIDPGGRIELPARRGRKRHLLRLWFEVCTPTHQHGLHLRGVGKRVDDPGCH